MFIKVIHIFVLILHQTMICSIISENMQHCQTFFETFVIIVKQLKDNI